MQLLKPDQIAYWYKYSLQRSGFSEIRVFVREFWKELAKEGNTAFPPGFLALLIEELMSIPAGNKIDGAAPLESEVQLIEGLRNSHGFDRLEGIFILNGADKDLELGKSILRQLIDRLPQFRSSWLVFSGPDMERSFSSASQNSGFDCEKTLDLLYKDFYQQLEIKEFGLSSSDIFEISHPSLFEKPTDRIFYRKMTTAMNGISLWTQSVFTLKEESNWVVARYGEPQVLPIGGYDAISNKGNLSSIIPSELAYIDETMEFDLFDYKYLESQLMYFKRDSGAVFRIRRNVHVKVDLTEFFEHERHLGLLFAWVQNLSEKIVETFVKDLVNIYIHFSGYQPSSLTDACNFFKHFLKEKGLGNRISLVDEKDGISADEIREESQSWLISDRPDDDKKFVRVVFPQSDEFARMEPSSQEKILGNLVNKAVELMVENADS